MILFPLHTIQDQEEIRTNIIKLDCECFPNPWGKENWEHAFKRDDYLIAHSTVISSGFILCEIYEDENGEPSSYIHKIVVDKDQLGSGLAGEIHRELVEFLKSRNIVAIFLDVAEQNLRAINFYKKNGYGQQFIKKKFYSNGDNALYMKLTLK